VTYHRPRNRGNSNRPSASPETQRLYGGIAALLVEEVGAKPGQMMGMPTLFLGGKAFAGLSGDAMVFKLDGEVHAFGSCLAGSRPLRPVRDGPANEGMGAGSSPARLGVDQTGPVGCAGRRECGMKDARQAEP